jgi:hypothetical protein
MGRERQRHRIKGRETEVREGERSKERKGKTEKEGRERD